MIQLGEQGCGDNHLPVNSICQQAINFQEPNITPTYSAKNNPERLKGGISLLSLQILRNIVRREQICRSAFQRNATVARHSIYGSIDSQNITPTDDETRQGQT